MQEQLKIAGAFVGVIVGAGFASGRELLLFFVDFGVWGLVGALVSAALFTFLGMALAGLGNRQQATSHKDVIQAICGRHLGLFVDWLITFFMFAVTVVMLAGGGALLEQQFGIPALTGSVMVTLVVVAIVCLDVRKVILAIGAITPLLILVASAIALYAVFTREQSFAALDQLASQQQAGTRHWLLGAFLYVSYGAGDVPDHLRHDRQHCSGHAVFVPLAAVAGRHGEVPLGLGSDRGGGVRLQPGGVHQPGGPGVPAFRLFGLCTDGSGVAGVGAAG